MNMEEDKVVQQSAEIRGDVLLELLALGLKSSEWNEPRSGKDLEEVGYNIDFRGVSDASQRVGR